MVVGVLADRRDVTETGTCAAGVPRGVVLMDAGYGTNTRLREEISALGLTYVAGIPPQSSVWPPGTAVWPRRSAN